MGCAASVTHNEVRHPHEKMSITKVQHASCTSAIAALPKPIVHYKGFASRMLLKGASLPSAQLVIDDEGHERAEIERLAEALIDAICDVKPATIVWDGDAFASDSFTALLPRICEHIPGVQLCAFAYSEWGDDGFEENWAPVLSALPTKSPLTLVIVPSTEGDAAVSSSAPLAGHLPLNPHDYKYVRLGRFALEATGAKRIFLLGGGGVAVEESALALNDEPRCVVTAAFARRWIRPPSLGVDASSPQAVKMEASAESFAPMREQLVVLE